MPPQSSPRRFAEFKRLYPRREKWKDAEKAWRQVDGDTHADAILEALTWQVPLHEWDGGRFTPLPASYLRAERWTDEPPLTPAQRAASADPDYQAMRARVEAEQEQRFQRERAQFARKESA